MEKIKQIIYGLMQYRRSRAADTSFFEGKKHNDQLCPRFQFQCDKIFQAFDRYLTITYDIQGIWDRGTDVLIRLGEEDIQRYICLQIKSEDDFKKPEYLQILKAQYVDTFSAISNLEDYYIVICCNAKKYKDKIRAVEAAFSKIPHVHIIEPEYALTFYRLATMQIDAYIKSRLGAEDIVYREGLSLVADLTPTEKGLLYFFLFLTLYERKEEINQDELKLSRFLSKMYDLVPDYDRECFFPDEEESTECKVRGLDFHSRLSQDLDYLEDIFISATGSGYKCKLDEISPLVALMVDGQVRYGYEEEALLFYMLNLFEPLYDYGTDESA